MNNETAKAGPEHGRVSTEVIDGVASITFHHPKGNSLPGALLKGIAEEVSKAGANHEVKVVVLRSEGESAFCGGASFAELQQIKNREQGKEFFSGFARLILAMKRCPKFIIVRVHSKAVGGGVGVVAAADYALATNAASARLSELALGIGPFVVGPAVERKIGMSAFAAMALDYDWRDATWCKEQGLYHALYQSVPELDSALETLTQKLTKGSVEAMTALKRILWQGTEHWDTLLDERASISGTLVLSDFTKNYLANLSKG